MPRQILPEGQEGSVQQVQPQIEPSKTTLSSSELDSLFHQWDASGKNDLTVDLDLANRLRGYLAQQMELERLKAELAELVYKPFAVKIPDITQFTDGAVYIENGIELNSILFYHLLGRPTLVHISDFKTVALALGNSQIAYAPEDNTVGVNIGAYLSSLGIRFHFTIHTSLFIYP